MNGGRRGRRGRGPRRDAFLYERCLLRWERRAWPIPPSKLATGRGGSVRKNRSLAAAPLEPRGRHTSARQPRTGAKGGEYRRTFKCITAGSRMGTSTYSGCIVFREDGLVLIASDVRRLHGRRRFQFSGSISSSRDRSSLENSVGCHQGAYVCVWAWNGIGMALYYTQ